MTPAHIEKLLAALRQLYAFWTQHNGGLASIEELMDSLEVDIAAEKDKSKCPICGAANLLTSHLCGGYATGGTSGGTGNQPIKKVSPRVAIINPEGVRVSPRVEIIRRAKIIIEALGLPEEYGVIWTAPDKLGWSKGGWSWHSKKPKPFHHGGWTDIKGGDSGPLPSTALPPWPDDPKTSWITRRTEEV
jgi:hypothetical protein